MPNIFLLQPDGQLLEMSESPYDSEDVLQRLLATHPNVLAGDQFSGDEPLRWLLITREAGIPGEDAGGNRWAVDHLFLDQYGVPTLVEVKRSTDTRIRREVVGQMLDYAANAAAYWSAAEVRERFSDTCHEIGIDIHERLAEFLKGETIDEDSGSLESFWETVETNLRAGKLRLVFVADEIPRELRRIVEFLNSQMDPAEVIAIEIKQYANGDVKTLVPRVIGRTGRSEAKTVKGRATARWDQMAFLSALAESVDSETVETAKRILAWIEENLPTSSWGSGANYGCRVASFVHSGRRSVVFSIWTYGKVEMRFKRLRNDPPFTEHSKRKELAGRLNEIPGVVIPDEALSLLPSFDISLLNRQPELAKFLAAMDWLVSQVKGYTPLG